MTIPNLIPTKVNLHVVYYSFSFFNEWRFLIFAISISDPKGTRDKSPSPESEEIECPPVEIEPENNDYEARALTNQKLSVET